jgi:electron transfer flavoprotein beta subunit
LQVIVFTRSTPDTAAKVEVGANGAVTWGDAGVVVNPWDEYALEEAITQAKNASGKATVIAIGGELHNEALKHSLAMGMDEAVRVDDPALDASDAIAYAAAAAAAVRKAGGADLVLFGRESIDVGTDAHIYATARKLGYTMLANVSKIIAIDAAAKTIQVQVQVEQGRMTLNASLPAVISVTKEINEPRYPSFIGIRKASKAVIPTWSLGDLKISATAKTRVSAYKNLPPRSTNTEMISGTPQQQAETLVARLIEEKLL